MYHIRATQGIDNRGYVVVGPGGWSVSPIYSERLLIAGEVDAISLAAWLQNEFGWQCHHQDSEARNPLALGAPAPHQ